MSWADRLREALEVPHRGEVQTKLNTLDTKLAHAEAVRSALRDTLDTLEGDMALVLELLRSREPGGQLYLGREARERAEDVVPVARQVSRESRQRGATIPPELLLAIMWTESHFDPEAVGPDTSPRPGPQSAYGLMQIFHTNLGEPLGSWPSAAESLVVDNWRDPLQNTRAGAAILIGCGWASEGTALREVLRCYSGASPGNTEAINDYTSKVTNRYVYLRWGPILGISTLEV